MAAKGAKVVSRRCFDELISLLLRLWSRRPLSFYHSRSLIARSSNLTSLSFGGIDFGERGL